MSKGILFVLSAPAGCGKDTILEQALQQAENLHYSVSATTRAIRPGERDGVSYFFKNRDEFISMINDDELLEYTEYCGNFYGTPKKAVTDQLEAGKNVVLKIEIEGAANIKKIFPDAVLIFILPPSLKELDRRLHKRGTEDEETIKRRLETAKKEISAAYSYDYAIVNGELDLAVKNLLTVVEAESFSVKRARALIDGLRG